jgi:adenine-specific DNA methylase
MLDPFAGGGSIPFEAARFGCDALADELNPVAAAILTGTVDLPFRLPSDFAGTIRRWGGLWANRVRKQLDSFFPVGTGETIVAYIWAHTVPCPVTGRPTPLAPNYWLASPTSGRSIAVRVEADSTTGEVAREIVEGAGASNWGKRATYKRGTGTSIWTGQTFDSGYINDKAQAGELGQMMLAVSVTQPGKAGRRFRVPTTADLDAVEAAREQVERETGSWEVHDLVPSEPILHGEKTDEPRRMGIVFWRQMFTPRQLLTTVTALAELQALVTELRREVGEEQTRAVALYLAFCLDKALNYNSRFSGWHPARVSIANVFDRHDYGFKWSFGEFDGAHALLPWAVDQVADAYAGMAKLAAPQAQLTGSTAPARVQLGSAIDLAAAASGSVDALITDPPYYNNVMYGECADYFLVWLRRSLKDTWPEYCQLSASDKEAEAVANPSLFQAVAPAVGGRRRSGARTAADLADEHYEDLLTRCFAEAHRVLKDDGVMTVMFTHKRVDAWDTLGHALLATGFSINSSWPVHTESEHSLHQAKKNAASSTILLTCRKRADSVPAYWSDIRGEVGSAARHAADRFSKAGLHGIDLTLATFGPVLSVLSRNWPVYTGQLDAAGKPELIRPDVALDMAREEVAALKKRGLLGGREVDFDRITDWWLLAWTDFQAVEFPAGEALKLSLATHLELDDLVKIHKVIRATAGSVTILSPAQRRTARAFDPAASSWATMLDGLHSLMVLYDEDGAGAAGGWLGRTGYGDSSRFHDLVAAALHAVPRTRDRGDFARPEARTLEGIRLTLFDDIPAPQEADIGSAEMQLSFDDDGDDGNGDDELGS